MTRAFRAKYPGRCDRCDERIHRNDMIRVTDDEMVIHALADECIDDSHRPVSGAAEEPLCTECWTYHRGDC